MLSGKPRALPKIIRVPDRKNTAESRLRPGDIVPVAPGSDLRLEAVLEVGFEELEIQK